MELSQGRVGSAELGWSRDPGGSDLTMYFLTVGDNCDCRSASEAGVATHAFRRPAAGFVGDLRVGSRSVDSQPTGLLFTRGDPLQVKSELEVRWYFPTVGGSCGGRSDSEAWRSTRFSDSCGRIRL